MAKENGVNVKHIIVVSISASRPPSIALDPDSRPCTLQDGHPHDFAAMFWFAPSIKRLFTKLNEWVQTVHPSGEA